MSYTIRCGSVSLEIPEPLLVQISPYWTDLINFKGRETVTKEIVLDPTMTSPEFITDYFDAVKTKDYDTLVLDYPTEAPYFADMTGDVALIEAVKYRISISPTFEDILLYSLSCFKAIVSSNIMVWKNKWQLHRAWNTLIKRLPNECFELVVVADGRISSELICSLIADGNLSKLRIIKKHQTSRAFLSNSVISALLKTKNLEYISLIDPGDDSEVPDGLVCEIPDAAVQEPVMPKWGAQRK